MKKFNVSMDEAVFDRLEDFSQEKHVNRSAVITLAVQQYLDAQDKIPDLYKKIDEISEYMPMFKMMKGFLNNAEFKSNKD